MNNDLERIFVIRQKKIFRQKEIELEIMKTLFETCHLIQIILFSMRSKRIKKQVVS
jgi:hypothetical protein